MQRPTAVDVDEASPAMHIALEEALRVTAAESRGGYFLTYVNPPCVIIGRNQDPATETRSGAQPAALFRRTSGGGAVYHDEGNLNWSFIVPGSLADREVLLGFVIDALRDTGIPAEPGPRGEIMANGLKLGGTASAASRGAILFHGTVLVDADLQALEASLAAHGPSYRAGMVASVPSRVVNAAKLVPGVSVASIRRSLVRAVARATSSPWRSIVNESQFQSLYSRYSSESWIYERKALPC